MRKQIQLAPSFLQSCLSQGPPETRVQGKFSEGPLCVECIMSLQLLTKIPWNRSYICLPVEDKWIREAKWLSQSHTADWVSTDWCV